MCYLLKIKTKKRTEPHDLRRRTNSLFFLRSLADWLVHARFSNGPNRPLNELLSCPTAGLNGYPYLDRYPWACGLQLATCE